MRSWFKTAVVNRNLSKASWSSLASSPCCDVLRVWGSGSSVAYHVRSCGPSPYGRLQFMVDSLTGSHSDITRRVRLVAPYHILL